MITRLNWNKSVSVMYIGIPPFRREKERYTSLLKRRGTNRLLPFPTTPYA